jgi:hypothetical protein
MWSEYVVYFMLKRKRVAMSFHKMFFVVGTKVDCFHKMYHVETSDGKVFWKRCVKDNRKVKVISIYKQIYWSQGKWVQYFDSWKIRDKHLSSRSELYVF